MNYCRKSFTKLMKNSSQLSRQFAAISSSHNEILQQHESSDTENPNHIQAVKPKFNSVQPSFNIIAPFVNDSELLKNFVHLGVNLSKLEKRRGIMEFILRLDFERDVKKYLLFLSDLGVPSEAFGYFLTKNPMILKESIEDLTTRIYYLQSKKFEIEQIQQIVTGNPFWLSFPTKRIDKRLGFFQKNFNLTGNELRVVTVQAPRLITYNIEYVKSSSFAIKEEMGFSKDELKSLILSRPRLWMIGHEKLMDCFDFLHNVMQVPHEKICRSPELLQGRRRRMEERHAFLKYFKLDQFDETKPNYIPLTALSIGADHDFVIDICKSTPETYDNFLKTL